MIQGLRLTSYILVELGVERICDEVPSQWLMKLLECALAISSPAEENELNYWHSCTRETALWYQKNMVTSVWTIIHVSAKRSHSLGLLWYMLNGTKKQSNASFGRFRCNKAIPKLYKISGRREAPIACNVGFLPALSAAVWSNVNACWKNRTAIA